MITIDLLETGSVPDLFTYDAENPTQYTEWLSWWFLRNFSAMQAAGFKWTDGQTIAEEEELETILGIWTAQNNLITQQTDYLKDIKYTFNERRKSMPKGFTLSSFIKSEAFSYLVEFLLAIFPGEIDDTIYHLIREYAQSLLGHAVEWLENTYTKGAALCERMREENTKIRDMPMSMANYKLRSQIITQHDESIQSLMAQVAHGETQVQTISNVKDSSEIAKWLKHIALSEHVIECPYTGMCIYDKSEIVEEARGPED